MICFECKDQTEDGCCSCVCNDSPANTVTDPSIELEGGMEALHMPTGEIIKLSVRGINRDGIVCWYNHDHSLMFSEVELEAII